MNRTAAAVRDVGALWARWMRRRRLKGVLDRWGDDFVLVMVVVPNVVHLAIPALRLLNRCGQVLVLGNGLRAWEFEWLRREFPHLHVEQMTTAPQTIPHGEVMELVAAVTLGNFGFVDPDCYVFSADVFGCLTTAAETSYVAAPFWLENTALELDVPDTFFIGINGKSLAHLKTRYGVAFGVTDTLPRALAQRVEAKWRATPDLHPHPWKTYYDTAHAVTLAGAVEGMAMGRVASRPGDLFHVCGTSYHQTNLRRPGEQELYVVNAHYFHLELLKRTTHPRVLEEFAAMKDYYGGGDGLLRSHREYADSQTHDDTRQLLAKLASEGVI